MPLRMSIAMAVLLAIAPDSRGQEPRQDTSPAPFSVAGKFSVDTPAGGFQWTEAQKMEIGRSRAVSYACTKGGVAYVVLMVEERTARGDSARIATIKNHYNGLVESLRSAGFTDLKGAKPGLKAPIPDRTSFSIAGRNAKGQPVAVQCVTVFGKNVYAFQVFADSPEEANRLAAVAQSLREPKREKGK